MLVSLGQPACLGKKCRMVTIDGQRVAPVVEAVIFLEQSTGSHRKLACLQKLRFEDKHFEYRFAYYIEGHKPGRKGHWVFGQYALTIPAKDLKKLLSAAKKAGWPGF
jgi:hypothetical protein